MAEKIHKTTTVVGDVEVQTSVLVPTTECNKLLAVSAESQKIGAFIDWLRERDMEICKLNDDDDRYWPRRVSVEQLLAEYFEIDLVKVEKERRALLEAIRR